MPPQRWFKPLHVQTSRSEAARAEEEIAAPDVRRLAQGLAWAAALTAPFWIVVAAIIWL